MTSWILVYERLRVHCPKVYYDSNGVEAKIDSADRCILYLYLMRRWSISEIAKELEGLCSFHTVRNRLVKMQVDRRARGGLQTKKKKITLVESDLLLNGKEVAVKYGISLSYAYLLKRQQPKEQSPL